MPIDVESLSNKFQARTSKSKSNIFSVSEVLAQAESERNKAMNLAAIDWKMGDPRNGNGALGRFRDTCGKLVNNKGVQWAVTFLLIVNAILMGVTTFDFVKKNETLETQLEYFDVSLLVPFTIEFLLQFFYLGKELRKDLWLVFDGVIVVLFWAFMGAASVEFLDAIQIFRVFALVSRLDPLKKLVSAAAKTIPKMGAIVLIVFMFFYVFAVFYTNLYAGLYEEGYLDWDYFGRLDFTFVTLFQFVTLDSWTTVARQVMDSDPYAFIGTYWKMLTEYELANIAAAHFL
jgi:voltage-gated sodium channel